MKKAVILVSLVFVGAFLLLAVSPGVMRPFGSPVRTGMDDHFISDTRSEVAANNAVTAVVFDYRGFDTLGEATVLFAAVVSVLALFRKLREEER